MSTIDERDIRLEVDGFFAASFLVSSYAGNKTLAGMMLAVCLVATGALVGSAGRSDAPETERIVIVLRQGGRRP